MRIRMHKHTCWLALLVVLCANAGVLAVRVPKSNAAGSESQSSGQQELQRHHHPTSINNRPIIGILSQPGSPAPENHSYIAASYVKWVEAAGARVIPILYDYTDDEITQRFQAINAVLIPGGGAVLRPGHRFYDAAALLLNLAQQANDKGDYFPVHGTCLGFEALSVIVSSNYTILGNFEGEDAAAPLLYTDAADTSHLFTSLPKRVVHNLQDLPIAMENHHKGLSMAAYESSSALRGYFKVLSLSMDKVGNTYVSTMEGIDYPVTALQWHPEKNSFEWASHLHIPHTPEAIEVAQEVANFFVSEARRNNHGVTDEMEEQSYLIYNWAKHFTGKAQWEGEEKDFEECYFFPDASLRAAGQSAAQKSS